MPGGVFLAVGILAFLFTTSIALVVLSLCAGVLLIVLPLPFLFARYGVQGGNVRRVRRGIPRSVPVAELSLILCIYDEYRRWQGFQPAVFRGSDGEVTVPALVLVQGLSPEEIEKELDLCDTRMNARLTYGKNAAGDMLLDFDFLRDLVRRGLRAGCMSPNLSTGCTAPPSTTSSARAASPCTTASPTPSNKSAGADALSDIETEQGRRAFPL